MKIALLGYGKMGQMIDEIAKSREVEVISRIDRSFSFPFDDISVHSVGDADVVIDFTASDCVVENVKKLASIGRPVVIGTTGWKKDFDKVQDIVDNFKMSILYGENFSMGFNAFLEIVDFASRIIDCCDAFDTSVIEMHHKNKKDYPSGSALLLRDVLLKSSNKSACIANEIPRSDDDLQIVSVRNGFIVGKHQVCFDSCNDSIELLHSAKNRKEFAIGAIEGARWIVDKGVGMFHVRDIFKDKFRPVD